MLLLHGGAGPMDPTKGGLAESTAALRAIAARGLAVLTSGKAPLDVVVDCLKELELDELFNAGRGSSLQRDGQARLTAALMDGERSSFSGVISVSYVTHPSLLARTLQDRESRVLTNPGAEMLARELGLPLADNVTPKRRARWFDRACDTVGCLVRTTDGRLFAGTSTGGRGFETPGRVSDSATVAGTYCTPFAAVSATGVGEQIVDDAVAARLETRRRDGLTLELAARKCFAEAREKSRSYGWIAVDAGGFWSAAHTTPAMTYVVLSAEDGEVSASAPRP